MPDKEVPKLSDDCCRKIGEAMDAVTQAMEAVAQDLAKAGDGTEFAQRCHGVDDHLQQALEALEAADSSAVEYMKDEDEEDAA